MRIVREGSNQYVFFEAGEICGIAAKNEKWMRFQQTIGHSGVMRHEDFMRKAAIGDESMVEKSEAFLSKIEDQVPLSRGWRNVDDVVGSVPNIPAFLAGHPQSMRRRQRVMRETAPLTVFMDLTSNMGIHGDKILRRGIVLLALVRMLVTHRPVELWVGTSLSDPGYVCTAAWKIDTAPMDLARAAFHIADVSMSRIFGYATCEMLVDKHIGGIHKYDKEGLKRAAGWHDVMYIPPIWHTDPMVDDPVGWLKRVMSEYIRTEEDAA